MIIFLHRLLEYAFIVIERSLVSTRHLRILCTCLNGSSCRDTVDCNRRALFARAHIRSVRPSPTRRAVAY